VSGSTLPSGVISGSSQITALGFVSSSVTASSVVDIFNTLANYQFTYTKGDGTQQTVTLNAPAETDITSLNAFTASQLTINSGYNTFTSSANQRLSSIESVSGSWITESETASFARTNVDNNFTANQTFTNITAVSASFTYVQTTYETASVIYSSGSNQFGDELSDIQTLSGSVKVQGSLTVNGTPVLTSSVDISGLVTTASFNQYTQSNNQRVSSLEVNSASVNTSISTLNQATSSLFESASLALVTASASGNTITFTKGNTSTFSVTVDTGSAATTIFEVVYTGENITKGDPLYISGSQGANPRVFKADASNPAKMPVTFVSNETIGVSNTTNAIVLGLIEGIDLTGYVAGQSIYVAEGGGWSASLPSGSNSVTQLLGVVTKGGSGGKGLVLNPGPAQLPGLDTGKMWVGNGNNQPTEITTASFASSASFNDYTSSNDQKVNSLIAATGSYATTGSNIFTGDQYVSNGVLQVATYPQITKQWFAPTTIEAIGTQSVAYEQFVDGGGYDAFNVVTTLDNGTEFRDLPSDTFVLNTWLAIPQNTGNNPAPQFKRGLSVTGSTNIQNLTASLQDGYVWVGNSSGRTTTVSTSSFGGGTINTGSFATTGSNIFNGAQIVNNFPLQVSNYNETTLQAVSPTVFQGIGTASVAYQQYINAGNYDAIHIQSNLNAGTDFQDLPSDTFVLNTWLNIPTNTGNNPAPRFIRGLVVSGSNGLFVTNTINSTNQRIKNELAFTGSRFVSGPLSMSVDMENLNYTQFGFNQLASSDNQTGARFTLTTNKDSNFTQTQFKARYTGSADATVTLGNTNTGNRTFVVDADTTINDTLNVTGNSTFTGQNIFKNLTRYEGSTPADSFANIQFVNNQSLSIAAKSTSYPGQTGSFQIMSMSTGSGGNASFQMTAEISGTIGQMKVNNNAGTTIVAGLADTILFAKNEGFPNTPATTFTAEATSINLKGAAEVSGSLRITGSAYGNVVALSITSNTASMDLSRGNYFTLTLADTATTHISASNVQPGMSATLVITTGTNSSASLAPTMLQPSGSAYSATNGSAKKDVLSIVSVASGVPYVVSTKNMI
jgi:hypothetical protein